MGGTPMGGTNQWEASTNGRHGSCYNNVFACHWFKKGFGLKKVLLFLSGVVFWVWKSVRIIRGDKHVHICYTCSQHLGVVVLLDTVYYIFPFVARSGRQEHIPLRTNAWQLSQLRT